MESKKRTLTKEEIVGMQVVDSEGYIFGKVKDIYFVVGKPDETLLIVKCENETETEICWSSVSGAGDVILVKSTEEIEKQREKCLSMHCVSCGSELEEGTLFCPNCGNKAGVL